MRRSLASRYSGGCGVLARRVEVVERCWVRCRRRRAAGKLLRRDGMRFGREEARSSCIERRRDAMVCDY